MNFILDNIRRWRTWIVNTIGALLIVLPEVLNAPEVLAIIPAGYQKWVFVAVFVLNIVMRPRAAVIPSDYEAKTGIPVK